MHVWFDFVSTLPHGLKTWMEEISLLGFDARNIYLKASTPFHILWFKEHVQPKFYGFLKESRRKNLTIHFDTPLQKKQRFTSLKDKIESDNFLNPLFTLDHFFIAKQNELIPFAIEKKPKLLYLYGPKGVGKTHLLHALAAKEKQQGKKVAIVDCKRFVWHFTTAIRTKQMQVFRRFYRNADCLFFDNVELLEDKIATQEELFHLFNAFHLADKSLAFTASFQPNKLPLPERLISRFSMNLVLPIKPLTTSESIQLIQQKAERMKLQITDNAIKVFEQNLDSSKALVAFESLAIRMHHSANQLIDTKDVESIIKEIFKEESKLSSCEVLNAVSKAFTISLDELTSKSKKFAKQRAMAMYFCRNKLDLSFTAIGKLFNKDHSTVMSAIKKFDQQKSSKFQQIQNILSM